ncbi:F0F1 ATP synthase subunit A [Candidatus Gottesmanbacteria bacterium]|nr:F0F1 ATP synthase subunit A [Candidatus Gottesmanbacteria bacterium]
MPAIHISITAEKLFMLGGMLPVTNSLLSSWIVMALLLIFSITSTWKLSLIPGNFQSIAEIIVDGIYTLFYTVLHEKIATFFPLLASLFIFIISMNWVGILPGVGTIGLKIAEEGQEKFIPLFRAGTADLNMTLALAFIAVVVIQYYGVKSLGIAYLKRFINFKNPIYFFVGILELMGEFTKVISFAFRLFGNIFAGEVLLTVIAFLMPFLVPLPFLGLELFVGFIQALVFSMLTAAFLAQSTSPSSH